MGRGEVFVRTTTVVIAALVLATFGLGSTWAFLGRRAEPLTPHSAEQLVREAQHTASAAAHDQMAAHPIPVQLPGQSNADRLAALDAWFEAFRAAPAPAASGDQADRDAAAVANVQARASTLLELSQAYQPIGDDKDPELCARAHLQLTEIRLTLAQDLRDLPVPAYLTPDQQAEFSAQTGTRIADQEMRARIDLEVAQGVEERVDASSDVHEHIRALEHKLGDA